MKFAKIVATLIPAFSLASVAFAAPDRWPGHGPGGHDHGRDHGRDRGHDHDGRVRIGDMVSAQVITSTFGKVSTAQSSSLREFQKCYISVGNVFSGRLTNIVDNHYEIVVTTPVRGCERVIRFNRGALFVYSAHVDLQRID